MADILDELREVKRLRGNSYSSYEVIGMVGRAVDEIERLRALLDAARICLKNRDQSEYEAKVYAAICVGRVIS